MIERRARLYVEHIIDCSLSNQGKRALFFNFAKKYNMFWMIEKQHSCLMMDNDGAWMYYHDEVVEQIDLNSMLNATESICSALGFKLDI